MKLTLIVIGKIKDAWLQSGIQDYVKRLCKYVKLEIVECPDEPDHIGIEAARAKEAERMLKGLPKSSYVIALDLHGKASNSETFSDQLMQGFEKGGSHVTILIAGSNGYDPSVFQFVDNRWSLSPLTFTHQMTRLVVLEQIYRAFKIHKKEPYHK